MLPSSCHPGHITRNIPYSLAYRLLRICSDPCDFCKRLEELRQDLLSRNYNTKIVQDAFDKIKLIDRKDAIKKVVKTKTVDTVLAITYHPAFSSISSIVKKHHKVMTDDDPRLRRCFTKPSVVAYKRPKNLKDLLIRSKFQSGRRSDRKLNGYTRCGRGWWRNCEACKLIPERGLKTHTCDRSKETFTINSPVTCTTRNVVYKISCRKCNFFYIGETSRRFCDRFLEHRGYVLQKDLTKPVGEHFNTLRHSADDIIPTIIEQVLPDDNHLRLRRETFWINKYEAIEFGANKKS